MQQTKVSIIVPVYNAEKYIEACIQSVLKQTYTDWELVLVDDGSTDESINICRSYADKDARIQVISQKNQGVSAARNTGLANAHGEYITFVDSDDELEPVAVELLLNDILSNKADISSAAKSIVTLDGRVYCSHDNGEIRIFENDEMIKRSLAYDDRTRAVHGMLFDTCFLNDVRFISGHNINEDGYFLFECYAKKPKVVQHNVSVYKYYQRENSASRSKFAEKYLDMLYFSDLKMKYIQEKMPELIDDAKNMQVRTCLLFLDVLCKTNDKKYRPIQKDCVKTIRSGYGYYKPINTHYKKLAVIVALGLYPVYKWLYRKKFKCDQ